MNIKKKINHYHMEVNAEHSEFIERKLQNDTMRLCNYVYKIRKKKSDKTTSYILTPEVWSSGSRNAFVPIINLDIVKGNTKTDIDICFRLTLPIIIIFCILSVICVAFQVFLFIYKAYHQLIFHPVFLFPSLYFLCLLFFTGLGCYIVFKNFRNALFSKFETALCQSPPTANR